MEHAAPSSNGGFADSSSVPMVRRFEADIAEEERPGVKPTASRDVLLSLASGSDTANTWRGFDTKEVLRLILQTLEEMGYKKVASSLEEASGVKLLRPDMRKLQQFVLDGNWKEAGRTLLCLPLEELTRQGCWFLIMQHKFLEKVVDPNTPLDSKLACLRKDLSPAAFDDATTERLHACASLLMYKGSDLMAHVLQISSLSRSQLFRRLTCLLPSSLVMQPSRLATALVHARRFHTLCCPVHVELQSSLGEGLLEPHKCKMPMLPQCCVGCLHAHRKEVWVVTVAPKPPGATETLVASGGADNSVCVWLLGPETAAENTKAAADGGVRSLLSEVQLGSRWLAAWLEHEGDSVRRLQQTQPLPMRENGKPIGACRLLWRTQRLMSAASFLTWDSSGKLLAAGGESGFVEAWEEGHRIGDYCTHSGSIVALEWVPDTRQLVTVGSDRTMTLVSVQRPGVSPHHKVLYEWTLPARPQEAFILPGGDRVMVFLADRQAKVFDVVTKEETFWIQGKDLVVAACASKVCNQILMSTAKTPPVLRLYDLDERKVVQKYRGHKMGRLSIRPAFGGRSEDLVISGSEDAQIYIWHRLWGCMLQQLRGHAAAVNDVAWLPSCGALCLASAGDDGVLLLWSYPAIANDPVAGYGGKQETDSGIRQEPALLASSAGVSCIQQ